MSSDPDILQDFAGALTSHDPKTVKADLWMFNTDVVNLVLEETSEFEQLYQCYFSKDEVVRYRTSNAMKRLWRHKPELVVPHIDRFLAEISKIDQASSKWTLAQLFSELDSRLSEEQRVAAIALLKDNLVSSNDWIVINHTLQTLGDWACEDIDLRDWLKPYLDRFSNDSRKSIARRAMKLSLSLFFE